MTNKKVVIRMENFSTIGYSLKQGLKNIYRNRMFSLASIGTMTACLFMFGIFYFILSNFQYMIHNAETSVAVTVFFDEGITQEQITAIGEQINSREEVESYTFISAEEAWENFKEEVFKDQEDLEESFGEDNPLADSASYQIYLNDISKQSQLVNYLEKMDGVRQVNSSDTTASSLTSFNTLVAYVSAAVIIILLAVAVFLINTTVAMGISVRKDEISIMRLIGATDFLVRAPFIVEGIVIGLVGAAIPLVILYFIYNHVVEYISTRFSLLSNILTFLSVEEVFAALVPISLLLGIGIGFLGSFMTVRKHLRV